MNSCDVDKHAGYLTDTWAFYHVIKESFGTNGVKKSGRTLQRFTANLVKGLSPTKKDRPYSFDGDYQGHSADANRPLPNRPEDRDGDDDDSDDDDPDDYDEVCTQAHGFKWRSFHVSWHMKEKPLSDFCKRYAV